MDQCIFWFVYFTCTRTTFRDIKIWIWREKFPMRWCLL